MSAVTFPTALAFTLKEEGGFSDDPHDPGGATMDGITLSEFRGWYGTDQTVDNLKAITQDQLTQIYTESYWNQVRGDDLPPGIDLSMFDFGVNAGPVEAIKVLQRELAVTVDGIIGPLTLAAIARQVPTTLIGWLKTGQERFYRSLSTFQYFGKGWINRTIARQGAALAVLPSAHAMKVSKVAPLP